MIPENFETSLRALNLPERMQQIASHFAGKKLVFSTSFGQEDQAITHAIASQNLGIEIFTLDRVPEVLMTTSVVVSISFSAK